MGSASRMAKSVLAAFCDIELIDPTKAHLICENHHELSDPVSAVHGVGLVGIRVDQHHLDLSAIARINESRCIETAHTVMGRKPAPRQDQPRVTTGQCNCDSCWDKCSAAARRQFSIGAGNEIDGSIPWPCIGGLRPKVFVEDHNGYLKHIRTVAEYTGHAI